MPFDRPRASDHPLGRSAPAEEGRESCPGEPAHVDRSLERFRDRALPDSAGSFIPESSANNAEQTAEPAIVAPAPRPVTRAWCDGSGVLFSWEVAHAGGSAWGVARSEERAIQAVTDALRIYGAGQGIVQQARLSGYREDERDQYCYGRVVAHARVVGGIVEWVVP